MKTVKELITEHEFFRGLDSAWIELIAGCGRNVHFEADQPLFREGDPADDFFVIRRGRVALEVFLPERGPLVIDTLDDADVVGWSWLFPPYRWHFDARAIEPTSAISLDGACLRGKSEEDPRLGYELMKRFGAIMWRRLEATRVRLLDLYGHAGV